MTGVNYKQDADCHHFLFNMYAEAALKEVREKFINEEKNHG